MFDLPPSKLSNAKEDDKHDAGVFVHKLLQLFNNVNPELLKKLLMRECPDVLWCLFR